MGFKSCYMQDSGVSDLLGADIVNLTSDRATASLKRTLANKFVSCLIPVAKLVASEEERTQYCLHSAAVRRRKAHQIKKQSEADGYQPWEKK